MKKYISFPFLALSLLVMAILLSGCKKKDEEDPLTANDLDWIEGTFIFKNATFVEMVDMDDDGPMQPTDNALYCLYDIFNMYLECPSINPTFEFTKMGDFNQFCIETGQSRYIGSFTFNDVEQWVSIFVGDWNNPGDLYHIFQPFRLFIQQANKIDGLWNFQGDSFIKFSAYGPEEFWFNFELQEIIIE